jgi:hypothetical protein
MVQERYSAMSGPVPSKYPTRQRWEWFVRANLVDGTSGVGFRGWNSRGGFGGVCNKKAGALRRPPNPNNQTNPPLPVRLLGIPERIPPSRRCGVWWGFWRTNGQIMTLTAPSARVNFLWNFQRPDTFE